MKETYDKYLDRLTDEHNSNLFAEIMCPNCCGEKVDFYGEVCQRCDGTGAITPESFL